MKDSLQTLQLLQPVYSVWRDGGGEGSRVLGGAREKEGFLSVVILGGKDAGGELRKRPWHSFLARI